VVFTLGEKRWRGDSLFISFTFSLGGCSSALALGLGEIKIRALGRCDWDTYFVLAAFSLWLQCVHDKASCYVKYEGNDLICTCFWGLCQSIHVLGTILPGE
jgi:hypothetical protein